MRVFKYLVALADISVGFLGLFFIIFAITRPTLVETIAEKARNRETIEKLQQKIRELEEINLAKASSGNPLSDKDAASITIRRKSITMAHQGHESRYRDPAGFARAAQRLDWPASVILYVDRRVAFDRIVQVIDALRQSNAEISVRIAALAK